jgi:hypothetical protein
MMRRLLVTIAVVLLGFAAVAATAGADPTRHFTVPFTILCGPNQDIEVVIVSKPGSSNVVTVNGQPTNAVSILFSLYVVDDQNNVVVDYHKPSASHDHPQIQTCVDTSWPPGWSATAETRITPAGQP